MKKSFQMSAVLMTLIAIAGCGNDKLRTKEQKTTLVPVSRLVEIKQGSSDIACFEILGEPSEITRIDDHEKIWKYVFVYTKNPGGDVYLIYNGPIGNKTGDYFYVQLKDNVVVKTWTLKS